MCWPRLLIAWLLVFPYCNPGLPQGRDPADQHGDPLPAHAVLRIGTTRLRPNLSISGRISSMAFTGDGKRLVMLTEWRGVQVWDLVSGNKLLEFGKPEIVGGTGYALSPDGTRAAVIESPKLCRIYDTTNGKLISAVAGDWYGSHDLRFSPDNKLLGVSHREETAVWDVASGKKNWHIPLPRDSRFGAFAFSPTNKIVVFAPPAGTKPPHDRLEEHSFALLVFDVAKGPSSESVSPIRVTSARKVAFSPDGKILASERWNSEFILWDFASGKTLHDPKTVDDTVWCMCFSPDGKLIATGSNHGRVRLWDVATGKLKRKFAGVEATGMTVAFSADGKRLAASSSDGTFRVWDVDSGKDLFDLEGHRMRNVQARFGSDGKTIVSICGFNPVSKRSVDERVYRFWDSATGKPLRKVELGDKEFLPFCLSANAKMLFVIDDGKITRKDLETGKVDDIRGMPGSYYRYECSADGKYLAGHTDEFWSRGALRARDKDDLVMSNVLKVVDTTIGKEVLVYEGRKGAKFHCRFTEDGCKLAVHSFCYETDGRMGSRSGMELKENYLTIWDVLTGQKTPEAKLLAKKWDKDFRWPGGEALSPTRDLALTRGKDRVELRELATGAKLAEFPATGWDCESWAFSPDGKFVAVGTDKGEILLWSVFPRLAPPKALFTLAGHSAAVTSVHFSADSTRLVSGSDDTTILVWNVAPWTVIENAKSK